MKRDETPTYLFNPSKTDFTYPMANEQNVKTDYTLPSRKIVSFPKYIAAHLAKHLASKLAIEDDPKRHFEDRYNEQLKKIIVVL